MCKERSPISSKNPARRILVLGRELNDSEATGRYLAFCGHEVTQTRDPGFAERAADVLQPQVLVCDLNPDSDVERIRIARKILKRYRSDVVIISTHRRSEIRRRLPELNPTQVLRKPISLHELARSVA